MSNFQHTPVLLDEVVHWLDPQEGRRLVDATAGGGGHSEALLERGATVLSLDQDEDALIAIAARLDRFSERSLRIRSNFRDFPDRLEHLGWGPVDGLLLDVGVSSWQIDAPERGFSFQSDGPLDMRMDRSAESTAADLLAEWSEQDLSSIFFRYGEEQRARRIARAIVERRRRKPLQRTTELAALIEEAAPRQGRLHPATRVFQALRMAVNDELGALEEALEAAPAWLRPGGRLAVISFHSLEDRLVKRFMQHRAKAELDRPEWPAPRPNPDHSLVVRTKRPVTPGPEELGRNPRSRSARLRVAEKIPPHHPSTASSRAHRP